MNKGDYDLNLKRSFNPSCSHINLNKNFIAGPLKISQSYTKSASLDCKERVMLTPSTAHPTYDRCLLLYYLRVRLRPFLGHALRLGSHALRPQVHLAAENHLLVGQMDVDPKNTQRKG